jgi:hypothetical protein
MGDLTIAQLTEIINKLGGASRAKQLIVDDFSVEVVRHLVDGCSPPYIPNVWWQVHSHIPDHFFWEWNPDKLKLIHLWDETNKETIEEALEAVASKELMFQKELMLNANFLDDLLDNPHLIPADWKTKWIIFPNTKYFVNGDDVCVRCLCDIGDEWTQTYIKLDSIVSQNYYIVKKRVSV